MESLLSYDLFMLLAVLFSPLVAVQVTRYLDDRNEKRERKLRIFKTLMATRASNLTPAHVEALNMIDLEFDVRNKKEKAVIDAWKNYLDHLNAQHFPLDQWVTRRVDLQVELLHAMAIVLGYEFDKVHIKNSCYSPRGHAEIEDDQTAIRRGFREIIEGKRSMPIHVMSHFNNNDKV